MTTTTSCTDSIGGRVDCENGPRIFNKDYYQTYLIGDSFVQAEEVDYNESVYGLINNSASSPYSKAYGLGFSSWNTRQYLKAIKAINKENSNYDIYLFANDITPRYPRSTYGEARSRSAESTSPPHQLLHGPVKLASKSITVRKINELISKIQGEPPQVSQNKINYWKHHQTATFQDCASTETQEAINSFPPIARDYIMYSYPYACWDNTQKEAYMLAKNDLMQILNHGRAINSTVRFILSPPGFSFPNENTPGRLNAKYYGIPNDVRLSLFGLRERLAKDFPNSLIDIEDSLHEAIEKHKKNCVSDCKNSYYFGHDGHYTKRGHQFLLKSLYSESN